MDNPIKNSVVKANKIATDWILNNAVSGRYKFTNEVLNKRVNDNLGNQNHQWIASVGYESIKYCSSDIRLHHNI